MDKLTGKARELFIEFLIKWFRQFRPDYIQFSDEQIVKKFERRPIVDQMTLICIFFDVSNFEGEDKVQTEKRLEELETLAGINIETYNKEFNSK